MVKGWLSQVQTCGSFVEKHFYCGVREKMGASGSDHKRGMCKGNCHVAEKKKDGKMVCSPTKVPLNVSEQ